ncbi:MAG: ROK family protein [Gammaproteobacteria bacterium]|nr:ROK family protein [Gammaproteobacteria bacterium]
MSIETLRIGVDLGGTKTEIVALSPQGQELIRHRVASPRDDYQATLHTITTLVAKVESELGATGTVGIATPGTLSPHTGRMKNANSVWLNGQLLKQDVETALKREIRLANDANCFALSEATDGAAAGAEVVFGVIVGTGTGGGVVVNGRVLSGINRIAGEWGHNPLPWAMPEELPGPACYCGKSGCIETYLSGPGMAGDYLSFGGAITGTITRTMLDAKAIVQKALAGDPLAEQVLQRYENRMARALAGVINILDPDVIVLGGGMSNITRWYTSVPKLWERYVFSDTVQTRLVAPRFGDSSGVRGAAWLWPE